MATMYDSVTLTEIPATAKAVAGYVNGSWPTYPKLAARWPDAKRISIAVSAEVDADVLDVEPRDATNAQAPVWVRRQLAKGVKRPAVYTSVSNAPALLAVLAESGIKRSQIRLWTAHYTHTPHLCSSRCWHGLNTTADGTQYTDAALGKNLDASLVTAAFLDPSKNLAAARRRALRAWILAWRARGKTWAWLKSQPEWTLWRKLGGK